MKKKQTFHALFIMAFTCSLLCLTSCNDNEEITRPSLPLHIEKTSYEVMQRGLTDIRIINGSGGLTLSVSNEKMLTASFTPVKAADYLGFIRLRGSLKGETSLTVTDNITHDTQTLSVKVTDAYLACPIAWSDHPAIATDLVLYFVNNTDRSCYFFSKDNPTHTLSSPPIAQGTYRFYAEKDVEDQPSFRLALTYPSDEKGNFTNADMAPTEHHFGIECKEMALYIIEGFLNVDWKSPIATTVSRTPLPLYSQLTLKEIGTEYVIETANVDINPRIPEGVLE